MPYEPDSAGQRSYTVLPADCLKSLPFQDEPIANWKDGDDLNRFYERWSAGDGYFDGTEIPEESLNAVEQLADELSAGSTFTHHEKDQAPLAAISYRHDPVFGGFAKAWVVWTFLDHEILAESSFVSLAHTLEVMSDMECAIELVKKYYYRQATICLRTFIEDLIYPLYFVHHPDDYPNWQSGAVQLPTVRGEKGILAGLKARGSLDASVGARLGLLYGAQNRAVHGAAQTLVHAGTFDGNWRGLSFKADELAVWLQTAKGCLECGLSVVKRTADQWKEYSRRRAPFCDRCHSIEFVITPYQYLESRPDNVILGDIKPPRGILYVYQCKRCHDISHRTTPPP